MAISEILKLNMQNGAFFKGKIKTFFMFCRITQIAKYLNFDGKSYTLNVKTDGGPGVYAWLQLIFLLDFMSRCLANSKTYSLTTSN